MHFYDRNVTKMKLRHAISSRPEPRRDAFHVKNRERLDSLEDLPPKFAKLSPAQFSVLGLLYSRWLQGKSTSLTQLGTTQATAEELHQLRLIDLKGVNRQRAHLRHFGRRTYEVLYWQQAEKLEARREKLRSAFTGKRGKV
jgi:hypothetical protein